MKCRTLIIGIVLLFCIANIAVLAQDDAGPSPIPDPEPESALSGGGGGGSANGVVIEPILEEESIAICMRSDGFVCYNEPCDCGVPAEMFSTEVEPSGYIYNDSEVEVVNGTCGIIEINENGEEILREVECAKPNDIPLCCPEGERACPGGASPESISFELFLENLTGYTAKCVKPSNETAIGDVGVINVTNLIVTEEGVVFKFGTRKCINKEGTVVDLPGAVIIQPCDGATCSCSTQDRIDKDKGHGNDADRCDEDNPGKSGCPAEKGQKKGWIGKVLGFFGI